jgi:alpha-2-macroglobulin
VPGVVLDRGRMSHTPRAAAIVALLLFSGGLSSRAATAETTYESRIAAARALTAEGSHAGARAIYTEALSLATDENQKRWAQLWILAEDLAEDRNRERALRIRADLAKLLTRDEKSEIVHDRFWAAARTIEADTYWLSSPDALKARLEVATFWAAESAALENEAPFVNAVALLGQTLATGNFDRSSAPVADALELLRQSTAATPLPSGRAKLVLLYARALEQHRQSLKIAPALTTAAYENAVAATRGTADHLEALLRRAQWEIQLGPLGIPLWRNSDLPRASVTRKIPEAEFTRLLVPINEALAAASAAVPLTNPELGRLTRDLDKRRNDLTKPSLQIETFSAYLPESRFSFGIATQHLSEINFELHRVTLDQLHAVALEKPSDNGPSTLAKAAPFQGWTISTGLGRELGSVRTHHARPEALPVGAYVLVARATSTQTLAPVVRWFLVTKAGALAQSGSPSVVDVYAYDQESGKLLPDVRGRIWRGNESENLTPAEPGHGRGAPPPEQKTHPPLTIFGEAGGQPFFIPEFHPGSSDPDDEWLAHLNADRPLYQPGETAQWKLTVRHRVKGELQTPSGARLKIVAKIQDDLLGSWDVTLNQLGSASGKLEIPTAAAPGQVVFEVDGEGDDDDGEIRAFFVDHFRPPETRLTLDPLDAGQIPNAQPGGELALKVTAQYFSGEPVPNAEVRVGARFTRRFTWFEADQESEPSYVRDPDPVQRTLTTDSKGQAVVRMPLPSNLPPRAHLDIAASLLSAGTTNGTRFSFDVLPGGYTAEIAPASRLTATSSNEDERERHVLYAEPQKPLELAVFTRDGRDAPIAAKGHLTLAKKTWEEIWRAPDGSLLTGDALDEQQRATSTWPPRTSANSKPWELVRATYRTESAGIFEVAVDATGRASLQLPPLPAGYYELNYETASPRPDGRPLARAELFIAGAGDQRLGYQPAAPLVIPCVEEQEPGKPIRALVVLPVRERNAVVRVTGAADQDAHTEFFGGDSRIVEFPWKPGYAAGARLDVEVLAADMFTGRGTELKVSRDSHRALVTIAPESDRSRPGDKTRLRIHTSDSQGRPLSSEVALAVTDASVASLLRPESGSIADNFLRPVDISSVPTSRSARAVFTGAAAELNERPQSINVITKESMEDSIVLSPFQVMTDKDVGYAAGNVLTGGRVSGIAADVKVRSTFSYTAFWAPDVKTDRQGNATVEITYPDNLTAWQIDAEAIAEGNRFGSALATTQTSLPLQARLRTPRTLVAGDSATLLGAVLNQTTAPTDVRAELSSIQSSSLELTSPALQSATVSPEGEKVLGWSIRAKAPGSSTLRFTAIGEKINDAMEVKLPVKEDGFYQSNGVAGRAADQPLRVELALPTPFDPTRTTVEFQISPGITPALVQGLPYLIDYPYGCVEQTVSRFLPAAVVTKLLRDLGFSAAEVEKSIMATTLPPPTGRKKALGFGKLDAVIEQSLARLQAAQVNGSFGWFPEGEADAYMTAYVLRGLNVAASAGIAVPGELHRETYEAVLGLLARNDPDLSPQKLSWILSAAAGYPAKPDPRQTELLQRAFGQVYSQRSALGPAGLALLAQVAHALQRDAESAVLRRNLNDGVSRATSAEFGKTAHWGKIANYFDGLDGAVESTALCLQALLILDPKDELVDAAATWLLLNRQSGRWNNTRDTALALLALSDYARARGETNVKGGYRLTLNGRVFAEKRFERASLLAPAVFPVDAKLLQPGKNQIVLERTGGDGLCYLNATTRSWAEAESTIAAGSFLKVSREFVRIAERDTIIGMIASEPTPLPAVGATVRNHERVECRLIFEVPHDLEYVILESPKPGGFEPLNQLSGWDASLHRLGPEVGGAQQQGLLYGRPLYREEHDDRSVFFLPHLPAGRWEIRYTLRALFAGDFRALPATAAAIYVPLIAANTEASRIAIKESAAR